MAETAECYFDKDKMSYVTGAAPDAAASMLAELKPSLVTVSTGKFETGSAVAIDDRDRVATDMHVALIGKSLQVKTPSGQKLSAQIEKLDVVKDMAILHVPGLNAAGVRPAKLDPETMSPVGLKGFTVGSPEDMDSRPLCVSEGTVSMTSRLKEFTPPHSDTLGWNVYRDFVQVYFGKEASNFVSSNQDALFARSNEWFAMPRLSSDAVAVNGVSGGALATKFGVSGIVQQGSAKHGSRSAPIGGLLELGAEPSRFAFQYDRSSMTLEKILPTNSADATAVAEATLANIISDGNQKIVEKILAKNAAQ